MMTTPLIDSEKSADHCIRLHVARAQTTLAAPWTNVYGMARSALATGTLLTLLANPADLLFRPFGGEAMGNVGRAGTWGWSLFFLVPSTHLEIARWASIAVLVLVISGWRPMVTGILHWYVSFSFAAATVLIDGGDHITAVLTMLMIPLTLTDTRRSHWSFPVQDDGTASFAIRSQIGRSSIIIIRIQVALIYLHAAVGKMRVDEWADGTAVYYWFTNPLFGAAPWLERWLVPPLSNPIIVTCVTWGVMVFELSLFLALVMEKRWWKYMLAFGLLFHVAIVGVHGLVSFFFAMAGALIVYLRPTEQLFQYLRTPMYPWRLISERRDGIGLRPRRRLWLSRKEGMVLQDG